MKRIFVQIASYRDPELLPTIRDCISKSAHPDRLTFGICRQYHPDDTWDNLDEYAHDPRFKIIDIHYKESKGCCWARAKIQNLYENEEYTLQLDSHHRFIKDWDNTLISMLDELKQNSNKPILTGYAPAYDPTDDTKLPTTPWIMEPYKASQTGIILFRPRQLRDTDRNNPKSPIKSRFYSGHFMFTLGSHCTEVKYDPSLYFTGEEMTMGARSYTSGYDMFHPDRVILWHEYTRRGRTKHWDDFKDKTTADVPFYELEAISKKRIKAVFSDEPCPTVDLGEYGLGTVRSLKEYCDYSEVDWVNNKIYGEPSIPRCIETNSIHPKSKTLSTYSYTVDWRQYFPKISGKFDVLSVIADDAYHRGIHRIDVTDPAYISGEITSICITFDSEVVPESIVIYGYDTISKRWTDKIEFTVPSKESPPALAGG